MENKMVANLALRRPLSGAAAVFGPELVANDTAPAGHDDLARQVYCVLGIPIDAIEMTEMLGALRSAAGHASPFLVSTPNLNFLVNSRSNPEFRESLLRSNLCPTDGAPIVWISRLLGIPIKNRIAGSDIFEALKTHPASGRPLRIFVFGGTEKVVSTLSRRLNSEGSGLTCVGWVCPGFVSVEELSADHFIDQINASAADFLVVALGAIKGQQWLLRNHGRLQIPLRCHLGATINFQAGAIKRAPDIVQKLGLEWLWRIKEEPYLFGRYWHDGSMLLRLLLTHILPLAMSSRLQGSRARRRHDFVIVPVQNVKRVTLQLSGDATAKSVPEAISAFRQAIAGGRPVEVNMSRVSRVDPRFFGLLLMLRKTLKDNGLTLTFVGISAALARQFEHSGLEYLLTPETA
jgi:N-acetylglucosaminyldiphosphoundecaprenol N-acetyl-beta-D-mannosaminyltransferase